MYKLGEWKENVAILFRTVIIFVEVSIISGKYMNCVPSSQSGAKWLGVTNGFDFSPVIIHSTRTSQIINCNLLVRGSVCGNLLLNRIFLKSIPSV